MEIAVTFLLILFGYVCKSIYERTPNSSTKNTLCNEIGNNSKIIEKVFLSIIFIYLTLLVGLREYNSEKYIDTKAYSEIFFLIKEKGLPIVFYRYAPKKLHTEVGYNILGWIFSIFNTPVMFNLACAAITYGLVYKFILRWSKEYLISSIVFLCMYFLYTPNVVRQMLASAILLVALDCILKKRNVCAIFMIALAMTFHKTAAVFFLVMFYRYIKLPKKFSNYIFLIVKITILMAIVLQLLSKIQWRYRGYLTIYTGIYKQKIAYFVIDALVIFLLFRQKRTTANSILLSVITTAFIFDVLSVKYILFTRIACMFNLCSVAVIPTTIINDRKIVSKKLLFTFVVVAYIIFFITKLEFSNLRNYFPWQFAF